MTDLKRRLECVGPLHMTATPSDDAPPHESNSTNQLRKTLIEFATIIIKKKSVLHQDHTACNCDAPCETPRPNHFGIAGRFVRMKLKTKLKRLCGEGLDGKGGEEDARQKRQKHER